ncbi:MAG: hypothetical protein RML40_12260, partial [Bacteroidota bacterium]|nr:hypothetical protein [Candidatus Kapabacteria bacterium]MDW8221288.1 hypothetical protein [Bacteroidota bacterium]
FGDGRDGVTLTATPGFERYEWLFYGSSSQAVVTTGTTHQKYVANSPGLYSVRAYVNGCESVSNTVRVEMRPVAAKPSIQRIGNYLSVVNPIVSPAQYYWVQRISERQNRGIEHGWEYAPSSSGTYFVRLTNDAGCSIDSDLLTVTIATVRHRIETGSYTALQGRPFDIQFRLTGLVGDARAVGATSVTLTLRCFAGLLFPMPNQRAVVQHREDESRDRLITLNFPLPNRVQANETVILGTLQMIAGIPSGSVPNTTNTVRATTATRLLLENIVFLTPTGKAIQGIITETQIGMFRLQSAENIASDNPEPPSSISSETKELRLNIAIRPNPIPQGLLTLEYALWHDTEEDIVVSAHIQDMFGNRVKTLMQGEAHRRGTYTREYSTHGIPQGTYVLVMQARGVYCTTLIAVY